jgi:hypothetical protein
MSPSQVRALMPTEKLLNSIEDMVVLKLQPQAKLLNSIEDIISENWV